jgi:hypothetical protein
MANEINIVLTETGLTLVAKIWSGNTQIGSDIAMTENSGRSGHYYANAPGTVADGTYVIIIETSGGTVKGFNEAQFIGNRLQSGDFTKLDELHKIAGLNASAPMTATASHRSAGGINLAISGYGTATTVVTRS